MKDIFTKIGAFVEECESNGVELFFSYSPHIGSLHFTIWESGKYTDQGNIDSVFRIYLEDNNFDKEFESIKSQIKEKYYVKDSL